MAESQYWPMVICLILVWGYPKWRDSTDHLKSIDKKMHTHAADGSLVGIRGWY